MGDLMGNPSSALEATVACMDVSMKLVVPFLALDEAWAWVGAGAISGAPRPMVRAAAGMVGAAVGGEDAASFRLMCLTRFIEILPMR